VGGGDRREARVSTQHPPPVPQVLQQVVDRGGRRQRTHVFTDRGLPAKRAARGVERIVRAQAALALFLGLDLEVRPQLAVQVIVFHGSPFCRRGGHHARDGGRQLFPMRCLGRELLPAGRRQAVVLARGLLLSTHLPPVAGPVLALEPAPAGIR